MEKFDRFMGYFTPILGLMLLGALVFMSYKYDRLKTEYQKAEADKVEYCKAYHALKCKYESVEN